MAAEETLVEGVVVSRSLLADPDDPSVYELSEVKGHRRLSEREELPQLPAGDLPVVREGLCNPQAHLASEDFEDASGG